MANIKKYTIEINGLKESTSAVDALNRQLDALEQKINKINSTKVSTGGSGSGSRGSSSVLSEEEAVQKEINKLKQEGAKLDAKIAASQDEIFKRVDATKQLYKETLADQKAIAAQERLTANVYSNTMQGMKNKLADLKSVINTTDLGDSDKIKTLTKEANELTSKLKEMEEAYGQFGRNVGNYSSAFDKIKVSVGNTVREYDNYKKAVKELKQERFQLSQTLGQESEQYKEIDKALKQLESDYNDLNKSSRFMDNLLDTMQSFTALASIGQGVSALFGFDDNEIQKSIQKLVALQNILKGIETIQLQMQRGEGLGGLFAKGSSSIDNFVAKLTGAKVTMDGLTASSRGATIAVRGLSMALKGIGIGLLITLIPKVIDGITNIGKDMDSTAKQTKRLDEAFASLNSKFNDRNDLLASSYLRGEISDEELLSKSYQEQSYYLGEQIQLLRERADLIKRQSEGGLFDIKLFTSFSKGGEFTGERMNGSKTVESYSWLTTLIPQLSITVNSIKEVEDEFKKCQEAIREGEDYFSRWGNGLLDWVNSLFTTVENTDRAMTGLGNIRISDFVATFGEANQKFRDGKISAEEFAKELGKLKSELNSSDVLRSVIANLDKYIPDEGVREAVNNIINQIIRLDDAFNMTSPEQIHHWMQVRIDAMAEGSEKIKAQIDADERYEIQQYGKTQEQINLIHAKYNRKRQDELKKYNEQAREKAKKQANELEAVERELNSARIEMMKEGLNKQLAQLEEERRQRLQKAKDNGIRVGELTVAINDLYDKKVADAKKKWAADILRTYQDLYQNIQQINRSTFSMEVDNSQTKVENRNTQQKQNVGYSMINESNFDDLKNLEEYYKKVLEIEKKASEDQAKIQQERLDKELEYNKQAEKLRHDRLVNTDNGEYKKQLKAGLITQEQYDKLIEAEKNAHNARMNALDVEYAAKSTKVVIDQNTEQQRLYNEYYTNLINDIRRDKEKIDEVVSEPPARNDWGFVNFGLSKENYNKAIQQYENLKNEIVRKKEELKNALKAKTISAEDFSMRINELKKLLKELDKNSEAAKKAQKDLLVAQIGQIIEYVQKVVQSINDVFSALWDAQDVQFEKEQEKLDKLNEELDKKLDEQQEIVKQHKDNINSIEDELATARGDRRQHLIDQLNAEMAAQRAAQQQEKKIQKEKEAAQKKQDALDLKRKKAQYKRDMMQAIVNGAMAITMAAVNYYPVPAIPMMALAAASTAAQIAIMASNKPYAKGGLLEGKSHAQGGIPIPGTGIEVEGKEYVVRKKSTAPNIDLLEYINKSERKLDLSDFIDFYSGDKPKKAIRSVRNKFEDGGYMPALPNALDVRDQLQNVIVNQDNRPIVVSVVDINSKQEEVRRVQTLAGLEV